MPEKPPKIGVLTRIFKTPGIPKMGPKMPDPQK